MRIEIDSRTLKEDTIRYLMSKGFSSSQAREMFCRESFAGEYIESKYGKLMSWNYDKENHVHIINTMRVIGYIPLYYGAEYLEACIQSMAPYVEKIIIVYTDKPSQGHATHLRCPETEEQLQSIAFAASDKIEWHKGNFCYEAEHRDYILNHCEGYDLIFTLDADEIVEPSDIEHALKLAYESDKRHIGFAGFINFWRSFSWACHDSFIPYRIVNLRNAKDAGTGQVDCRVYHFSTAQAIETVRFKWGVSGHKDELRKGWIDKIYLGWTPENGLKDLHPVAIGLWNATPFDKNTLPEVLKRHVNFNKELI